MVVTRGGTPYVSYVENKDWGGGCCNAKAVVSKYDRDSKSWLIQGQPAFGVEFSAYTPLGIDSKDNIYAVLSPYGGSAPYVMKLAGSNWVSVGYGFPSSAYYNSITINAQGMPYVAYNQHPNPPNITFFDGNDWQLLDRPSEKSISNVPPGLSFSKEGELFVAYVDSRDWGGGCCTNKVTVKKLDANTGLWGVVGLPGIATSSQWTPAISFSKTGNPIIAFAGTNDKVQVYQYDGQAWGSLGNIDASGKPYLAIDSQGLLYLAAGGTFESTNTVWRYDGLQWKNAGYPGGLVQGLQISSDGTPFVLLGAIGSGGPISVVRYVRDEQTLLQVTSSKTDLIINEISALTTSGGSGSGAITYKVSGPCTLSGNTLTATAVGTCLVTATKDGDADYFPIISAPISIGVSLERERTLSISKSGFGTITSIPANISCGANCSAQFVDGLTVSLIAQPDYGYAFAGWGAGCSGTGTCAVTMNSDISVSANFIELPKYQVKITKPSTGVISSEPAGILCGGPSKQCISSFSSAKLTAIPNPGYEFIRWNGCQTPEGINCYIKPAGKMTVSAAFKKLPKYNIKITKNTLGSIVSTPAGLKCPEKKKSCSVKFVKGTEVTVIPVPQAGRTFGGWTGACSGLDPCTFLMDGNKGVGAMFQ